METEIKIVWLVHEWQKIDKNLRILRLSAKKGDTLKMYRLLIYEKYIF